MKTVLSILATALISAASCAQSSNVYLMVSGFENGKFNYSIESNDIIGFWITEKGDGIVEVYSENGKYYGRLISLKSQMMKMEIRQQIQRIKISLSETES